MVEILFVESVLIRLRNYIFRRNIHLFKYGILENFFLKEVVRLFPRLSDCVRFLRIVRRFETFHVELERIGKDRSRDGRNNAQRETRR